jgi:hypothetical protein
MYFQIRNVFTVLLIFHVAFVSAQDTVVNKNTLEAGLNIAGEEALFYGAYCKFIIPLSHKKHYFTAGASITSYFDFKGESTDQAYLKNDIDMRVIPCLFLGYSLNFKKIQVNLEAPVGVSIAVTKGTLVNEKIGFERNFYNKEVFLNYGIAITPKYKVNSDNYVGVYAFLPLIQDKAQSGYQFGIGWTITFTDKK